MPVFLEVKGADRLRALYLRYSDFSKLAKPGVQAALDVYKETERPLLKRFSGGAQASVGTRINKVRSASMVIGSVGPRGGRWRQGYLAALFQQIGSGLFGPRHRRIRAGAAGIRNTWRSGVMAFPGTRTVSERFGASAFTKRGAYKRRTFGNAGIVLTRSTVGTRPRPWFNQAQQARLRADDASEKAIIEALNKAARNV